jgi:ATP-dependent Clp protease ATP-binding subunit ClpX
MSEEKNIHCSFCGRSKDEAEMMIAGVDAHICDRCVGQAGGILHAELGEKPQSNPLDVAAKPSLILPQSKSKSTSTNTLLVKSLPSVH